MRLRRSINHVINDHPTAYNARRRRRPGRDGTRGNGVDGRPTDYCGRALTIAFNTNKMQKCTVHSVSIGPLPVQSQHRARARARARARTPGNGGVVSQAGMHRIVGRRRRVTLAILYIAAAKDKYGIPGAPSGLKGADDPIVFRRRRRCAFHIYTYKHTHARTAVIIYIRI